MFAGNDGTSRTYLVPAVVFAADEKSKWTQPKPGFAVAVEVPRIPPGRAAVPLRTFNVTVAVTRPCMHRSTPVTPTREGTNSWRSVLVVSCPPGKWVWSQAGSPSRRWSTYGGCTAAAAGAVAPGRATRNPLINRAASPADVARLST